MGSPTPGAVMKKTLALLLLLPLAAAAEVYRWVDRDGVVHYTQSPPPTGDYKSLRENAVPPPTANPQAEAMKKFLDDSAKAETAQQKARTEAATKKAEAAQKCSKARERLTFLTERSPHRLAVKNEDGSISRMPAEEWEKRRAEAQKQIDASCVTP